VPQLLHRTRRTGLARLSPFAAATAVLLLFSAFGARASTEDRPAADLPADTLRIPDDRGDTLLLDAPARRIVSLIPAATEILFALGAGDRVVGRTRYGVHPPAARDVPSVGEGIRPSVEAIVSREPDVVIVFAGASNRTALGRLRDLSVPLLAVEHDDLGDFRRNVGRLGRLTGRERAADSLTAAVTEELEAVADVPSEGRDPEVLFWVGCAGCFDGRYQTVTRAFAKIMNEAGIEYAVLGKEGSCTGDPAKRAGHEFIFQMQATQNIETLNNYNIKKIVTACPHCFNTLKNEYPDMGGHYDVVHHSVFLKQLIAEGKVKVNDENVFNDKSITYHDACYLGRGNDIFEAPRQVVDALKTEVREMSNCKEKGLCCGAGGAQMFKEPEAGNKDVNIERTEQALETQADYIASACPFCMTMMTDGVKEKDKEKDVQVLDLAELVAKANGL
jgi:Fe-S oxidoreductase